MSETNVKKDAEKHENAVKQVHELADEDGQYEAPIDLDIKITETLTLTPLSWYNYDVYPKRMKITNTGHTVIISGKWGRQRPFIKDGPLVGKGYVFSQLHFHWGSNDTEGSEHTVEGFQYPMEMHVVHFKSSYLTQESALKEKDGIAIMVYIFKLQYANNPDMEVLSEALPYIRYPQTSARVDPLPMSFVVRPFDGDYFLYWGSIVGGSCTHLALWFICRQPIGVSSNQLALFRSLSALNHQKLLRNFREAHPLNDRKVFHVLPSISLATTLLPISKRGVNDTGDRRTSQIAPTPSPFEQGDDARSKKHRALLNNKPAKEEGLASKDASKVSAEAHWSHARSEVQSTAAK